VYGLRLVRLPNEDPMHYGGAGRQSVGSWADRQLIQEDPTTFHIATRAGLVDY